MDGRGLKRECQNGLRRFRKEMSETDRRLGGCGLKVGGSGLCL